jgi:hypothetical protein
VGSVSGTVVDIGLDGFTYEAGSSQKQVFKGETLDQAQPVSGL